MLRRLPTLDTLDTLVPRLGRRVPVPARITAFGPRRAVVGMLTGCVQSAFFPDVNAATVRVLAAEGCDVVIPRRQGCCGALSLHSGREAEARRFARGIVDAFEGAGIDYLAVNSAGCGSSMKEYARLLADDPAYADRAARLTAKVRDLSEVLVELGPVARRHPLPVSVAYHDACHLAHGQGVRAQPRRLLRDIPGLELREIADPELCCGSAGVWNVLNPGPARELGDRKAGNVLATGAQLLVTANPGCLMQVAAAVARVAGQVTAGAGADGLVGARAGRRGGARRPAIGFAHTAQVLDASIRRLPVARLLGGGRM